MRYKASTADFYDTEDTARLTYLEKHWREDPDDFKFRVYRAHYDNLAKHKVIDPIVGLLTKRPPDRSSYPEEIKDWIDDIGDNRSLDLWFQKESLPWGLVYGHLPVLVTNDPHKAITKAQQEAEGAREARLGVVHCDAVEDWERDADGNYLWIKVKETRSEMLDAEGNPDPLGSRETIDRYTWYTQEGCWYCDVRENDQAETIQVLFVMAWPPRVLELKKPPIAEYKRGKEMTSFLASIASKARRMYNQSSEHDEMMRGQTFNIFCAPVRGGRQEMDDITPGIHRGLPFDPEARHKPFFLAPDPGPIEAYERAHEQCGNDILEQANMSLMEGKGALAAATAAYLWQKTNASLADLSADMEAFEYDLIRLVCAWKGIKFADEARANWPDDFGAIDVERELANAGDFLNLSPGPTAEKATKLKATKVYMPDESEDFYSEVEKDLEAEAEAMEDEPNEAELAAIAAEMGAAQGALKPKPPGMPDAETP
jgi:hypothetical protein